MSLPSEQDTPEMRAEVEKRFPVEYVFEHGHWWVILDHGTANFSVVDTSTGLELEQV